MDLLRRRKWVALVQDSTSTSMKKMFAMAKLDIKKIEADMKEWLSKEQGFAFVFTNADYDARLLPPGMIGAVRSCARIIPVGVGMWSRFKSRSSSMGPRAQNHMTGLFVRPNGSDRFLGIRN